MSYMTDVDSMIRAYLLFLYNKDQFDNISSAHKKALKKIVEGVKYECDKKKKNKSNK